jgi:hypothetical protein
MNIKDLKEWISDLPDDYNVVLSRFFVVPNKEAEEIDFDNDVYEVILDIPVTGIFRNDSDTEIRFMVDYDTSKENDIKTLENFGTVVKYNILQNKDEEKQLEPKSSMPISNAANNFL